MTSHPSSRFLLILGNFDTTDLARSVSVSFPISQSFPSLIRVLNLTFHPRGCFFSFSLR